jgi:hypothetical protein
VAEIYSGYTDFQIFATDIFVFATLVFWFMSIIFVRKELTKGPIFLSLPLLGFTAFGFLSALGSIDAGHSFYHAVRLLFLAALYLYVVNEITSLGKIVFPVAVQVFIQSAVAIGQIFNQHSLGLEGLGAHALDPMWQGVSVVLSPIRLSLRAYGLSDHPNILGGCLAFSLLLIIAWYIQKNNFRRTPLIAVMILGIIALVLTYSRSAWLAFLVGSGLTAYLLYRKKLTKSLQNWLYLVVTLSIAVLPILWLNSDLIAARLGMGNSFRELPTESTSLSERESLNRAAAEVFVENSALGVGIGTMPQAIQQNNSDFEFFYQPAHFALLEVAGEIGIFGGLFYAVILVAPWLVLGINSRHLISEHIVGISAILLAITLVGFFDYYTWLLAPGRLWQWIVWGLWARIYIDSQRDFTND